MATMASINPTVTADTPITIKLQHGAENKKTKLPLKDLKPDVLPSKLRSFLELPDDKDYVFERFSDSAGTFIKLDGNTPSVYKQLNRAAKAKLKLRIKVSPVEDMTAQPAPVPSYQTAIETAASTLAGLHITSDLPASSSISNSPIANRSQEEAERTTPLAAAVSRPDVSDFAPFFSKAALASSENQARVEDDLLPSYPSPPYNMFSVCCNNCNFAIPDHHWHCETCREGDFDLCQKCLDSGCHCDVPSHYLVKRTLEDGKIVSSTTQTISKTAFGTIARATTYDLAHEASILDAANDVPGAFNDLIEDNAATVFPSQSRTCNSCISIYDDSNFVTCKDCDDYDLCIPCHLRGEHGHHPGHTLAPALDDMILEDAAAAACEPGRGQPHDAICDGCDFNIAGVRYKCLECPDWDYCSSCYKSAHYIHPFHRFVPVYAPLEPFDCRKNSVHVGVRCDGPLCSGKKWITGVRYKCAICNDTDFCAGCEAHPSNPHNKTHPLIKFRMPMRDVSITTYHGAPDGNGTEIVGDRQTPQTSSRGTETVAPAPSTNASTQVQAEEEKKVETAAPLQKEEDSAPAAPKNDKLYETVRYCRHRLQRTFLSAGHVPSQEEMAACELMLTKLESQQQIPSNILADTKIYKVLKAIVKLSPMPMVDDTFRRRCYDLLARWDPQYVRNLVLDAAPKAATEPEPTAEIESKAEEKKTVEPVSEFAPLDAFYIRDYVSDGTKVLPGQSIYQSWTMYNPNSSAWPKGCALRWAGGDHMIDIDMTAPGSVQDFMAASTSNYTHAEVGAGGEYSFSVRLRAPQQAGRAVSYWRLYSPDGCPFGHRLWCDVDVVENLNEEAEVHEEKQKEMLVEENEGEQLSESQMVFPKLEKESPASSTQLVAAAATTTSIDEEAEEALASPVIAEEGEELLSHDDVESVTVDLDEDDDTTDDGFLTDEDYDMLEDARE